MTHRLAVVMDPIADINIKKDSTFAMLLEAQRRGYEVFYVEPAHLWIDAGVAYAKAARVKVQDNRDHWYDLAPAERVRLGDFSMILMRKDPPFDMEYVADTYVLDRARGSRRSGGQPSGRPAQCQRKSLHLRLPGADAADAGGPDHAVLREFVLEQGQAIIKPLDGMGGHSIFRVAADDPNLNVVLETVGNHGQQLIMAQGYVEEITEGDKRILLVDGVAVPYALARIPAADDFRGNLAKGGPRRRSSAVVGR